MKSQTKQKLKAVLFEISSSDKRENFLYKEQQSFEKRLRDIAQAITDINRKHYEMKEQIERNLPAYVQREIYNAKTGIFSEFESNKLDVEKSFSLMRDMYGFQERKRGELGEKLITESTEIRKEVSGKAGKLEKQINYLMQELEKISNLRPQYWGGSSRTFYINGVTVSPNNIYSDINLIAGSGIAITSVNNTTAARADVTISATGFPTYEPVNAQSTTAYTFALTDAGYMVTSSNSGATTFTIPPSSTISWPSNTRIDVCQVGAGKLTIGSSGGVTINSQGGNKSCAAQYVALSLLQTATDVWLLMGNLIA